MILITTTNNYLSDLILNAQFKHYISDIVSNCAARVLKIRKIKIFGSIYKRMGGVWKHEFVICSKDTRTFTLWISYIMSNIILENMNRSMFLYPAGKYHMLCRKRCRFDQKIWWHRLTAKTRKRSDCLCRVINHVKVPRRVWWSYFISLFFENKKKPFFIIFIVYERL